MSGCRNIDYSYDEEFNELSEVKLTEGRYTEYVSLKKPCVRVGCRGAMLPINGEASFDFDGSAMVGTKCSDTDCTMQSVVHLAWEGFDSPESAE